MVNWSTSKIENFLILGEDCVHYICMAMMINLDKFAQQIKW